MSWSDAVRREVDALLADLLATVPVPPSTGPDQRGLGWLVETLLSGGDAGFWTSAEDTETWTAFWLVDRVHDVVVEELPAYHLPTNWPPCPMHPTSHPLQVAEPGGGDTEGERPRLWWVCPATRDHVAPLGSLP